MTFNFFTNLDTTIVPTASDIDTCISDHGLCMTSDSKLISQNCMVKCKFNAKRNSFNNGFGISEESDEQYQKRLARLVQQLKQNITDDTIILCLQEIPEADPHLAFFINQLNVHLPAFSVYTNNENGVLIRTSVPHQEVHITSTTRSKLMAFIVNDIMFVNVHLAWKPKGEDAADLEQLRNIIKNATTTKVVFVGDFNREDHTIEGSMTHTIGIHEFSKLLCENYTYNLYTTNQSTNFTLQDGVLVFTTSDYYLEIDKSKQHIVQ